MCALFDGYDKVKEFFKFCEENQGRTLPKSLTGRAIRYALNQRVTLETFLKNPKIELTNNSAEKTGFSATLLMEHVLR